MYGIAARIITKGQIYALLIAATWIKIRIHSCIQLSKYRFICEKSFSKKTFDTHIILYFLIYIHPNIGILSINT